LTEDDPRSRRDNTTGSWDEYEQQELFASMVCIRHTYYLLGLMKKFYLANQISRQNTIFMFSWYSQQVKML